jgi:hypothetical protein
MPDASSWRNVPSLLAIVLAGAACGQDPPSTTPAAGGAAAAGSGTGGLASGGSLSSSIGGAITAAGGTVGGAGSSAGAATGGTGGSASGSAAGSSAGGTATAGSAGAPGSLLYSTDPATFGGEPRCQGFDICESFESAELGALPPGFTLEGYGTRKVGASADRPFRGARSLKLEIAAQGAATAWLTRGALDSLGAQHFGRAFFRIESPAPTEFVHFDLLQANGPYEGHTNLVRYASTGTGVGTNQGNWSFIYNVQPSGDGAGSEFGTEGDRSAHPRVDDWMCLEWSFDASKQVAQYYLDGAPINYLRIDTERAEIPIFDSLAVGFGKYQNTGAFLVYIDEVAFDGERIGCNN